MEIQQRSIRAIHGKAGAVGVAAIVDGVVSCNVAWAMVGSLEMHPAVLHLDLASHPSDSFALAAFEANGNSWITPPDIDPVPEVYRFKEMAERYGLMDVLDQVIYYPDSKLALWLSMEGASIS